MADAAAPNVLAAVVAATRRIVEIRAATVPTGVLERLAEREAPRTGRLERALTSTPPPRVIAECKRRSPSRGVLRADYDPAAIADSYEQNGAAAVSVLTEPAFFDGAPEHLQAVRGVVSLPVLRKDFIVDRYQLLEAKAWGASAVLLIVAVLEQRQLVSFVAEATRLGVDALVEVHERGEIARAVDAGARLIGINNRNLTTLEIDVETSASLVERLPRDAVAVAESGLKTADDLARLSAAGFHAFLVGERLMTSADPGAALGEIRSWQHA